MGLFQWRQSRDVLRTFVGISPVPALHLHESIAVVRIVTVVWAGVIWVIVRVVRIVRITPIPPPRVPIETETGNEKTIVAEKTAMAVKVSKTPAAKVPEMPASTRAMCNREGSNLQRFSCSQDRVQVSIGTLRSH
jgi:hypothetical protein